jgi:thiaminase
MLQTPQLIEDIGRELQPANERLVRHPYVQALETAQVPREKLRLFAGEQYSIIGSDLRSVAHLVSRFGGEPSRDLFLGVLQGERAAWDGLLAFARALGVSETDLQAYEPLPAAHAYTTYMAWLALYGSAAEVAAAYLVNFPAWGQNCGRLSRALQERYGLREPEVAFFDLFASPVAGFEENALAVIEHGLTRAGDPRRVRRAARLLQSYELLYWDTLYAASMAS